MENLEKYMDDALVEARIAYEMGEVPVGCVFVLSDKIIAKGGNLVNQTKNATYHAEFVCINQVVDYCKEKGLNSKDIFSEIYVIVTVEPCIMCSAALHDLNVKGILYGCANDRFGGTTVLNVADVLKNLQIPIKGGIKAEEAMSLLKEFYKGVNPSAPVPKRKGKN